MGRATTAKAADFRWLPHSGNLSAADRVYILSARCHNAPPPPPPESTVYRAPVVRNGRRAVCRLGLGARNAPRLRSLLPALPRRAAPVSRSQRFGWASARI